MNLFLIANEMHGKIEMKVKHGYRITVKDAKGGGGGGGDADTSNAENGKSKSHLNKNLNVG